MTGDLLARRYVDCNVILFLLGGEIVRHEGVGFFAGPSQGQEWLEVGNTYYRVDEIIRIKVEKIYEEEADS